MRALLSKKVAVVPSGASKRRLEVHANTLWSLQPHPKKSHQAEKPIDLTTAIGAKKICALASHDFSTSSTETVDMCITESGGVHVVFDSEGTSNPLDSPSILYITDIDSETPVQVDGQQIPRGQRTRVKPGAIVSLGGALFQVERNVFAHA